MPENTPENFHPGIHPITQIRELTPTSRSEILNPATHNHKSKTSQAKKTWERDPRPDILQHRPTEISELSCHFIYSTEIHSDRLWHSHPGMCTNTWDVQVDMPQSGTVVLLLYCCRNKPPQSFCHITTQIYYLTFSQIRRMTRSFIVSKSKC